MLSLERTAWRGRMVWPKGRQIRLVVVIDRETRRSEERRREGREDGGIPASLSVSWGPVGSPSTTTPSRRVPHRAPSTTPPALHSHSALNILKQLYFQAKKFCWIGLRFSSVSERLLFLISESKVLLCLSCNFAARSTLQRRRYNEAGCVSTTLRTPLP